MQTLSHSLLADSVATQRHITSFHFGSQTSGRKAYLQAGLHADEIPGMLVLHHLKALLGTAESAGLIAGEIVLVPLANPIGQSQHLLYEALGRFDLASGENFNRLYPELVDWIDTTITSQLGSDPQANLVVIRAGLRAAHARVTVHSELQSLRHTLLGLALDADLVLDLHCDTESLVHLYTEDPCWADIEPLARLLGAQVSLLAYGTGARSFDETLSGVWWQLPKRHKESGQTEHPIPQGCAAATVELRGEADVSDALAAGDAKQLLAYLVHMGHVGGTAPTLPPLQNAPTPLAASESVPAPHAGIVVFAVALGERVVAGQRVACVIDAASGIETDVMALVDGLVYARSTKRYTQRASTLLKIAGRKAHRSGVLLGP
jgi:uncharacterized protein